MRDYLMISSSPAEEDCVQVGEDNYRRNALRECMAFKKALCKKLGEPPKGAELAIKAFPHDFGTYHEVVCYFDDNNKEAFEYALKCESDFPMTWAEVGTTRKDVLEGKW